MNKPAKGKANPKDAKQPLPGLEENHYRNLVELSHGLICTHDMFGIVLSVNPAAARNLGYESADIAVGRNLQEYLSPATRHLFPDYLARIRTNRQDSGYMRMQARDGSERVWFYRNVVIDDGDGASYVLGHAQDVTEPVRIEHALRESEERYRDLFENSNDLIQSVTPDGSFEYVNRAWLRALGYSEEEVLHLNLMDIVHTNSREHCLEIFQQLMAGKDIESAEAELVTKDGRRIAVEGSIRRRVLPGQKVTTLGMFRDVTKRKFAEEALRLSQEQLRAALEHEKELSRIDFLTQVANRRAFYEMAEFESKRSRRYQRPISLAYIDIDNFKQVNDRMGHEVGDRLLVAVAASIQKSVRETDLVARVGGDEFVLLLPETAAEPAQIVLGKVRNNLLDAMERNAWPVTFSIGLATFPTPPDSVDAMVKFADDLMYSVKNSGKDRIASTVVRGN